eukprot:gb/GECH01012594.1/.p1 GENE.gb/GECH01012594.1/~~gb/GECH01012594.1/.p1  ORF type:complete len:217 (+),score=37.78 gb/GECH01012594.1/:1-651(+)
MIRLQKLQSYGDVIPFQVTMKNNVCYLTPSESFFSGESSLIGWRMLACPTSVNRSTPKDRILQEKEQVDYQPITRPIEISGTESLPFHFKVEFLFLEDDPEKPSSWCENVLLSEEIGDIPEEEIYLSLQLNTFADHSKQEYRSYHQYFKLVREVESLIADGETQRGENWKPMAEFKLKQAFDMLSKSVCDDDVFEMHASHLGDLRNRIFEIEKLLH